MREIKFRAYHNGRMFEFGFDEIDTGWAWPLDSEGRHSDGIYLEDLPIQQYTGLHDKRGKEIYEGDIVLNHDFEPPYPYVVDWNGVMGWWQIYAKNIYSQRQLSENELEVIGNIYENPELLKPIKEVENNE